jgi:hypothetical protein
MLRIFFILCTVILGASPLCSEERLPLNPIAITLPKGNLPKKPAILLVQEPYCELGYGTCGGSCLQEDKKRWDCPAEALPCYHTGQRCTCEEADVCKPKKKP